MEEENEESASFATYRFKPPSMFEEELAAIEERQRERWAEESARLAERQRLYIERRRSCGDWLDSHPFLWKRCLHALARTSKFGRELAKLIYASLKDRWRELAISW